MECISDWNVAPHEAWKDERTLKWSNYGPYIIFVNYHRMGDMASTIEKYALDHTGVLIIYINTYMYTQIVLDIFLN